MFLFPFYSIVSKPQLNDHLADTTSEQQAIDRLDDNDNP